METLVLILVIAAAVVTIASAVWVAIGLMTALRCPNGVQPPDDASDPTAR